MGRATKHVAMRRPINKKLPTAKAASVPQKHGSGSSRNGIHKGAK